MAKQIHVESGSGNITVTTSRAVIGTLPEVPFAENANTANVASVANVANVALSVDASNVDGLGNVALLNLDGNVSNVLYGNGVFAEAGVPELIGDGGNLSNINGANVTGFVANANVANTALSVDGANVVGEVANAAFATSAESANTANVANSALSVDGANVVGEVANAAFATSAESANTANVASSALSVDGANVVGEVANAAFATSAESANTANSATVAATVTDNAQPNITSVGSLTDLSVSGNATVGGNLVVDGTLTYINVDTLKIQDPVIELGGGPNGDPLVADDGKDRGTLLHYYTTEPVKAFMGWDNSNAEFAFGKNVSISGEVVSYNDLGNVRAQGFIGDGSQLSNIAGANVTGNVANADFATSAESANTANVANSALSVDGANVVGEVANAAFATSANTANVANSALSAELIENGNSSVSFSGPDGDILFNVDGETKVFVDPGGLGLFSGGNTLPDLASLNIQGGIFSATLDNVNLFGAEPFSLSRYDDNSSFLDPVGYFRARGTQNDPQNVESGDTIFNERVQAYYQADDEFPRKTVSSRFTIVDDVDANTGDVTSSHFWGGYNDGQDDLDSLQLGFQQVSTSGDFNVSGDLTATNIFGNVANAQFADQALELFNANVNNSSVQFATQPTGQTTSLSTMGITVGGRGVQTISVSDQGTDPTQPGQFFPIFNIFARATINTNEALGNAGVGAPIEFQRPLFDGFGRINEDTTQGMTAFRFSASRSGLFENPPDSGNFIDVTSPVQQGDRLGSIEWRPTWNAGQPAPIGSIFSPGPFPAIDCIVDVYDGNVNEIPQTGFEFRVIDENNTPITHRFYSNGEVEFNGITIGNVAGATFDGSSSNVLFGNGVFAAPPAAGAADSIANGSSSVAFTGAGGDLIVDIDGTRTLEIEPGVARFDVDVQVNGNITANNLGNISSVNLTGDSNQILLGDGTFDSLPSSTSISDGNSSISFTGPDGDILFTVDNETKVQMNPNGLLMLGTGNTLPDLASLQMQGGIININLDNVDLFGASPLSINRYDNNSFLNTMNYLRTRGDQNDPQNVEPGDTVFGEQVQAYYQADTEFPQKTVSERNVIINSVDSNTGDVTSTHVWSGYNDGQTNLDTLQLNFAEVQVGGDITVNNLNVTGSLNANIPQPTGIQNGNSSINITGPGGDILFSVDGDITMVGTPQGLAIRGDEQQATLGGRIGTFEVFNSQTQYILDDVAFSGGSPFSFEQYSNTEPTLPAAPFFTRARGNRFNPENVQNGDSVFNLEAQAYVDGSYKQCLSLSTRVSNADPSNTVFETQLFGFDFGGSNNKDDLLIGFNGTTTIRGQLRVEDGLVIQNNKDQFLTLSGYTGSQLANITGEPGAVVAVSDNNSKLAYWDAANVRWSYVSDDSAV